MRLEQHPLRKSLTNELHARPSLSIEAPAQVGFIVLKAPQNAVSRPVEFDHDSLRSITDHFGLAPADPNANHYEGSISGATLKWEKHTEVATYTLLNKRPSKPYNTDIFETLPSEWTRDQSQTVLTSLTVEVLEWSSEEDVQTYCKAHLNTDGLVCSYVLDEAALIAGDFRLDVAGHLRFAVFVKPDTGPARVGRIVQRLCEIETYKSLSMLGFARAREISKPLIELDEKLTGLLAEIERRDAQDTLSGLLDVAATVESQASLVSFRFSATEAYETIVHQRISALRESRFAGRQTLAEFMYRRYDPAMRTVQSTRRKLDRMSERASAAAQLLRTRVDVDRSEQSQKLLESMNQRADAQLKLQKTVEGLSVVAISYYAVSLAGYLLKPITDAFHLDKSIVLGLSSIPIIFLVWWTIRSIRNRH